VKVLTGFTQRAAGRSYTMLFPMVDEESRSTSRVAAYVAKTGNGLAKKPADVAGKLILEQFPLLAAVEVRAGTLTTKVFR